MWLILDLLQLKVVLMFHEELPLAVLADLLLGQDLQPDTVLSIYSIQGRPEIIEIFGNLVNVVV
jgi:hypothetical protein